MFRHLQSCQLRNALLLSAKKLSRSCAPVRLMSNKKCEYSIAEVTIPSPSGNLAGQLWTAEESSSGKAWPPIVCAHGTLDNAGSFKGLLPLIIRPTLRPNTHDAEELVTRMKKYNDNVELHFVPGSHFVHMNEPELIAPLISAALKPLS